MKSEKKSYPLPDKRRSVHRLLFTVPPEEIGYVVMVIESYGHVAIPRTVDQSQGVMELLATADTSGEAQAILEGLKDEIALTILHPQIEAP